MRIDGSTAWSNALSNKHHRWSAERFTKDIVGVAWQPKFQLRKSDRFFCMGSCFARNVEEHLVYRDVQVLSQALKCPASEWGSRPSGLVNKFTTNSMQNEFDWILGKEFPLSSFLETSNGWFDLQLVPSHSPVSRDRAIERRAYLMNDYFSRIRQADVLIITLGFVETWFDKEANVYLNATPPLWQLKNHPGRFEFECTDVSQNMKALNRIHEAYSALSPNGKIIISVSPVPLDVTFAPEDIVIANAYSKSVLLCAARAFSRVYENVDYFPSYEMVTLSRRDSVYKTHDFLHVSDKCVSQVIDCFFNLYIGSIEREFPEFEEMPYLKANPDVFEAVRAGYLESGYHHWKTQGRSERRPLSLDVTSTN